MKARYLVAIATATIIGVAVICVAVTPEHLNDASQSLGGPSMAQRQADAQEDIGAIVSHSQDVPAAQPAPSVPIETPVGPQATTTAPAPSTTDSQDSDQTDAPSTPQVQAISNGTGSAFVTGGLQP